MPIPSLRARAIVANPATRMTPLFVGNLAEYAQKISAHDLPDTFLGISAAAHGCDDEWDIADVSHRKRKSGTTVDIGPQDHVVFPYQLNNAIGDLEPVVYRELQAIGRIAAQHGKLRRDDFIDVLNRNVRRIDTSSIPKRLAGMLRTPLEHFSVMEFIADLHSDQTSLGSQFLQQPIRHVARNIVELAQAVVGSNYGIGTGVDGLRDGFVGRMGNIDHHAEPVHLFDKRSSALIDAMPARRRTAGIGIPVRSVVGG